MRIFVALTNTLISLFIGFGLLFAFGMGGGFNYLTVSHLAEPLAIGALIAALIGGIAIGWVWALRPDKKLTSKAIITIFAISVPVALILMIFAQG